MSDDLHRDLERLLDRPVPEPDPGAARALEARLLAASAPPRSADRGVLPAVRGWVLRHRLAAAAVALIMASVGACRLPATYSLDMGERIAIHLEGAAASALDTESLGQHVEETWPVERVELTVRRLLDDRGGASLEVQLLVLGEDVEADEVWEDLVETYPVLAGSRVEWTPLEGDVHGTLGGRLLRELDVEALDRASVEEARRQILAELAAAGLSGDATVEVTHDEGDGRTEIRVEVRAEGDALAPGP